MEIVGYAETVERKVSVWAHGSQNRQFYVADEKPVMAPLDNMPLGLRPAPFAIVMAARGDLAYMANVRWKTA